MKYKTLFRLALKVIGVYMCVSVIPELGWAGVQIWEWLNPSSKLIVVSNISPARMWMQEVILFMRPLLKFGIGAYLFFGGAWIVNKAIPSNKPYCHECGYMLKNLTGTRCPECDTPFKPDAPATS